MNLWTEVGDSLGNKQGLQEDAGAITRMKHNESFVFETQTYLPRGAKSWVGAGHLTFLWHCKQTGVVQNHSDICGTEVQTWNCMNTRDTFYPLSYIPGP